MENIESEITVNYTSINHWKWRIKRCIIDLFILYTIQRCSHLLLSVQLSQR